MALTYQAAVEQTITAGEQIHQIVNGTATTEVTVEDGSKVPSIRKALLDNFYFKEPIAWQVGQTEEVFNQLRKFTDGSWWYAPSATAGNPISMGSTPVGDSLWKIYDFDAIGKLEPRIDESLRRSYAEAGYNLVDGSFEVGGVITTTQEAILFKSDGKAYSWGGALPKNVPSGSSPLTTGGLGPLSWTDRSTAPNYFKQNGGGAVVRSAMTKMRESLSVLDYGAVGDGSTDDTIAIQAAIDAAVAQKKSVYFPRTSLGALGRYKITSALIVSGSVHIYGDGYSGVICVNCSGFVINDGVWQVIIEKLYMAQATRYTVTPNSYKAIETLGTTANKNYWHIYRDLFIDGFQYALKVSAMWSSNFTGIQAVYCFGGIYAINQSVNNFVSNCGFDGTNLAHSVGIQIGEGTIHSEGWMISDCLISNFAIGVRALFATNSHLRGCIIDFFKQYGVILESTVNGGSINWTIADNYMATDSATGFSGVRLLNNYNTPAVQVRGSIVSNNQILAYQGASLPRGIHQDGNYEISNIITGNRVNATVYDCHIEKGTKTIVANNYWKGNGFIANVLVNYSGNEGIVLSAGVVLKQTNGKTAFYYASAAPTTGTYERCDIVWNLAPLAGGTPGWVCVDSGSPGTWKAMANLAV